MQSIFEIIAVIIIQLEARLWLYFGFTLPGDLAVFTHSAVTPLKVNRFG